MDGQHKNAMKLYIQHTLRDKNFPLVNTEQSKHAKTDPGLTTKISDNRCKWKKYALQKN